MIAYYLGAFAYGAMIALFVYRLIYTSDKKRWKKFTLFMLFMSLGVLLFGYEGESGVQIIQLILGMIIFNGMLSTYGSDMNFVYLAFAIVYIFVSYAMGLALMAQAMLLGMLSEVAMMKGIKEKTGDKHLEIRRDVIQIIFGIALISAFYLLNTMLADVILLFVIILGVFVVNVSKDGRLKSLSKTMYYFERRNTALGLGALWLALGALIAVSFLATPYVIVIFGAIFIGDSAATIVGVSYKSARLPHNSGKSVAGSLVYFLTTFIIGYIVIGPLAIPIAFIAALVESLPWKLDDNFAVSIVLVAIILAVNAL